eukprot:6159_1
MHFFFFLIKLYNLWKIMSQKSNRKERSMLLVYGYVHEFEKIIKHQIIPNSVVTICLTFYETETKLLFYLTPKITNDRTNPMYIVDLKDNTKQYKTKLMNIHSNQPIVTILDEINLEQNDKWVLTNCALCHVTDFKLPSIMHQNIISKYYNNNEYIENEYNIIFKNGGEFIQISKYISAICINSIEFNKSNDEEILAIDYELPSINIEYMNVCSSLLFNNYNELYCLGGWDSSVFYKLCFNEYSDNKTDWNWKQMPSLKTKRSWSAMSMIENDIIAIGGYRNKTVEIFNYDKKEWNLVKSLEIVKYQSGCWYDSNSKQVYVGGGNGIYGDICYYNIHKNEWYYDKTETLFKHRYYPLIWIEEQNILYISSCIGCKVKTEFIDLRDSNKKWIELVQFNNIDTVFDVKTKNCRIIV